MEPIQRDVLGVIPGFVEERLSDPELEFDLADIIAFELVIDADVAEQVGTVIDPKVVEASVGGSTLSVMGIEMVAERFIVTLNRSSASESFRTLIRRRKRLSGTPP